MRLIDADALGNRLYHEVFEKDSEDQRWDSGCWMRYRLFEKVLREQPTVEQPERKRGKWELIDDTEFRVPGYRCSACHCECEDWESKPTYNFCPNCGADMREGDDHETD